MDAKGAPFSASPGLIKRSVESIEFDFVHDAKLDSASVRCGWVTFLRHFIGLGSSPGLATIAKLFGTFLNSGKSVKRGVLCNRFDVVEAGKSVAGSVYCRFGDKEGAVENVGMFADRGYCAKVYRVFATGKTAFPTAFSVFVVVNTFKCLLVFFILLILLLLLGSRVLLAAARRSCLGCDKKGGT